MKKALLLTLFTGVLLLVSCKKKYDCQCATDVYDSNGYYVSTYYETYKVKARPLEASSECDTYEYDSNTYCYIN